MVQTIAKLKSLPKRFAYSRRVKRTQSSIHYLFEAVASDSAGGCGLEAVAND